VLSGKMDLLSLLESAVISYLAKSSRHSRWRATNLSPSAAVDAPFALRHAQPVPLFAHSYSTQRSASPPIRLSIRDTFRTNYPFKLPITCSVAMFAKTCALTSSSDDRRHRWLRFLSRLSVGVNSRSKISRG